MIANRRNIVLGFFKARTVPTSKKSFDALLNQALTAIERKYVRIDCKIFRHS
jgi:hypothetical protein